MMDEMLITNNIILKLDIEVQIEEIIEWISQLSKLLTESQNSSKDPKVEILFSIKRISTAIKNDLSKKIYLGSLDDVIKKIPKSDNVEIVRYDNSYILRVDEGYIIISDNNTITCFLSEHVTDQNLMLIKFFLNAVFVLSSDIFVLHGNIVVDNKSRSTLILGNKRSGKTTLSLLLKYKGMNWLCDDIVYVSRTGNYITVPFRYYTNIRNKTFSNFEPFLKSLGVEILDSDNERKRVHWNSLNSVKYSTVKKINQIIFPEIDEDNPICLKKKEETINLKGWELTDTVVMGLLRPLSILSEDFRKGRSSLVFEKIPHFDFTYNFDYLENSDEINDLITKMEY